MGEVEPLLPEAPPRSVQGGRPRVDDRRALNGILFVLRTGIGWEHLPQELGYGSGMTCWRRLRAWQAAGVWHRLHLALLAELRARVSSISVERGLDGAAWPFPGRVHGPNPTDRGKFGSKRHLVTDGAGCR